MDSSPQGVALGWENEGSSARNLSPGRCPGLGKTRGLRPGKNGQ